MTNVLFNRLTFFLALMTLAFGSAQAQEVDTFWDKARAAGQPAAAHYAIGGFTYEGSEVAYEFILPKLGLPKALANEAALLTTLVQAVAFEYDPLFNPGDLATESASAGSIELDGYFDALERSAVGISRYLSSEFGKQYGVGFTVLAFVADLVVTTQLDRDLRQ